MAERELIEALAAYLEAPRRGDTDIEARLAQDPEHRAQLDSLLDVARRIRPLPSDAVPSPRFRQRTRRRLLGGAPANGEALPQFS